MKVANHGKLILPALRGIMGNWVYYSTLVNLKELANRVDFAAEVHKSKKLSDLIQRRLKGERSVQIAAYLKEQDERFFNSLVVATYKGSPNWHAVDKVKPKGEGHELNGVDPETVSSVGFLTFDGTERLFALDGQHRLAGIKEAIKQGLKQDPYDEISVIFVAHGTTKKGLERTRRLFTTLNKTARAVSKRDIIALDEDDVMAICVRRLIEDTELFAGERVAYVEGNNLPPSNTTALTTIGTLYDVLTVLFTKSLWERKAPKSELSRARPKDEVLNWYFEYAHQYFSLLRKHFPELKSFFAATDTAAVVKKNRGPHGGTLMFRPIGLEIMTQMVARLTQDKMPLEDAVKRAAKLKRNLTAPPYKGLMWDPSRKTVTNAHKATLRDVLLYTLGDFHRGSKADLLKRYQRDAADDQLALPRRLAP